MSSFSDNLGWVELVFVAVVALGFGFYQLWSVNREIAQDKAAKADEAKRNGSDSGSVYSASADSGNERQPAADDSRSGADSDGGDGGGGGD